MVGFEVKEDEKRIFLALSPSKRYRDNVLTIVKEIQKKGLRIIFISINQPSAFITGLFEKNGIDMSTIFFIDGITRYAGGPITADPGTCRFVSKPGDLTAMSMAVTDILKMENVGRTVIFLDSVNAMLIYTSSVDLSKFIHFVISKLRILNISGIFLAVEKGLDPVLMSQLMTFADELIEFPDDQNP
ncbi:MAG: hypothetical protein A4E35_01564 [Methanoregula sp. PtaU1.Bin051]|nr:MAG: hypothetical protein A4E35_01564 [Methanoregula sp. PtaU1.Bin051]